MDYLYDGAYGNVFILAYYILKGLLYLKMEEDFIDKLLREIKEKREKDKKEAEEILKRIAKEKGFLKKWLK